jgi:quercetin dioxygenase-like cupin family protein
VKALLIQSSWLIVFVLSLSSAPMAFAADAPAQVVTKQVLATTKTSSGQPITLPQSDVQVVVTTWEIQPGVTLPRHLHPYPRYGYVLQGALQITNDVTGVTETYKAGDFIIESIGQWHHAVTLGHTPVKLLVIDQVQGAKPGNTTLADGAKASH